MTFRSRLLPWKRARLTVLYVGSSGRVDIAEDMQYDNWKYYEDGEALYLYLYHLSKTLPGMVPVD